MLNESAGTKILSVESSPLSEYFSSFFGTSFWCFSSQQMLVCVPSSENLMSTSLRTPRSLPKLLMPSRIGLRSSSNDTVVAGPSSILSPVHPPPASHLSLSVQKIPSSQDEPGSFGLPLHEPPSHVPGSLQLFAPARRRTPRRRPACSSRCTAD